MSSGSTSVRLSRRYLPLALAASLAVFCACREQTKVSVAARLHTDTMPTMSTVNISTLISDSGVTQYKIVAPMWKVFDRADDPYWVFPQGIYLQKYDRQLHVIATIAADSARYFKNRKLWRLDGHVEIRKKPRDLFLTQQVFWDQERRMVYSDSFIHIENATHMLEGHGFESNENFTVYSVSRPQGIFPVDREKMAAPGGAPGSGPGGMPGAGPAAVPGRPAPVIVDANQ